MLSVLRRAAIRSLLTSGLVGGLASTAFSQSAALPRRPGVQDPAPATQQQKRTVMDESAAAAAPTATNGLFVANFTIKLATAVPSGYQVQCSLYASVTDENTSTYTINNEISESASVKATISGSTATCSVKLPYTWYLTNATVDTVAMSYYIFIENASAANATGEARMSGQYVPGAGAIKVPANNATTTYSIAATI